MDSAHLALLLRQAYRLEQLGLPPTRLSKPRGSPVVSPHASPWYHCPLFVHLLLCLSCSICMIIACNSALILTGLIALDQAPLEARFPRGTCVLICLLVVSLLDYYIMLFNWLVAPGSLSHVSCIDKCIYLGFDSRSPSEESLLPRHGARHGAGLVLVAGPLPSFDF
jgi:hypothetical protein